MLHLFEGYGIELEYMIVELETGSVSPIADRLLQKAAGAAQDVFPTDMEDGPIAWSNEFFLHVIELKTNGPVVEIDDSLTVQFDRSIERITEILREYNARLLPTGMHPTMNPATQSKIWPHENHEIYSTYDRIFGCRSHGWANLQSCHLNLPFGDDNEFAALHAAIRALLPLVPAVAASSPIMDGQVTGRLDNRLWVYANNQRRFPSISGSVIPEPAYSEEDYQELVLRPMYKDIAQVDPSGELQYEWLNSRGAIARFDRHAIELRLADTQETPRADLALCFLFREVLRELVRERFVSRSELSALEIAPLRQCFDKTIIDAEEAIIDHVPLLRALGLSQDRASASEVWSHLAQEVLPAPHPSRQSLRGALRTILGQGPLARRMVRALGPSPRPSQIEGLYLALGQCLVEDALFERL